MGRTQRDAAEVKRRLLAELDEARRSIASEASEVAVQLSPATLMHRSLEKHRWAWIAGGTLAGAVLIRFLLPSKKAVVTQFRSDNSSETDKKRGVAVVVSGIIFTLVRRAVANYATTHLREHAKNYFESILNRRDPV